MVKIQTGDTSQTEYAAKLIQQTENNIQEYPVWLIAAFAMMTGLAIPSPLGAWGSWQRRRELKRQIRTLEQLLKNLNPKPEPTKQESPND